MDFVAWLEESRLKYTWKVGSVREQVNNLMMAFKCFPFPTVAPKWLTGPGYIATYLLGLERAEAKAAEGVLTGPVRPKLTSSTLRAVGKLLDSPTCPGWIRLFLTVWVATPWRPMDIPHLRLQGDKLVVDQHKTLRGRLARRARPLIFLLPPPLNKWKEILSHIPVLRDHKEDWRKLLDNALRRVDPGVRWRSRLNRNTFLPLLLEENEALALLPLVGHRDPKMLGRVYARGVLSPLEKRAQATQHAITMGTTSPQ